MPLVLLILCYCRGQDIIGEAFYCEENGQAEFYCFWGVEI